MIEFVYPAEFHPDLNDRNSELYKEVAEAIVKEVSKLLLLLAMITLPAVQSSARTFLPVANEVAGR